MRPDRYVACAQKRHRCVTARVRREGRVGVAGRLLRAAVHVRDLAAHLFRRARRDALQIARDCGEFLALERDVDESPRRAPRPDAVRVPGALGLDHATQVRPGRLVQRRRRQRVAEAKDRGASLLGVREEVELRVLDELGEARDGFVDPARRHQLLALGHARADHFAPELLLAEPARDERSVVRPQRPREELIRRGPGGGRRRRGRRG